MTCEICCQSFSGSQHGISAPPLEAALLCLVQPSADLSSLQVNTAQQQFYRIAQTNAADQASLAAAQQSLRQLESQQVRLPCSHVKWSLSGPSLLLVAAQ